MGCPVAEVVVFHYGRTLGNVALPSWVGDRAVLPSIPDSAVLMPVSVSGNRSRVIALVLHGSFFQGLA